MFLIIKFQTYLCPTQCACTCCLGGAFDAKKAKDVSTVQLYSVGGRIIPANTATRQWNSVFGLHADWDISIGIFKYTCTDYACLCPRSSLCCTWCVSHALSAVNFGHTFIKSCATKSYLFSTDTTLSSRILQYNTADLPHLSTWTQATILF